MESQTLHWISAFFVAIVVGIYATTRGERVHWSVVSLMAAIALWTAGTILRIVVAPESGSRGLFLAYYLGAVSIAPLWAILAARLTNVSWLSTRVMTLFGVVSVAAYLAAISNPLHHLYFRTDFPEAGSGLSATAGPLLWVYTSWAYGLVATGIGLFIRSAWRLAGSGQPYRGASIAIAACLPLVAGLARSLEISPPGHDATPIAIAIAVSALFALHWRHQMRDTLPLARRDVIEHLADGVIVLDGSGRILDSNPSADDIMGAKPGALKGRLLIDVVTESNAIIPPRSLEKAAAESSQTEGPWLHTFETRDGRVIESSTAEVRGGNGEPAGFFAVLRDQTERRRMEHFLRQSQHMETMAGFSAGIAHEINNPLAYIRSNLNHIVELTHSFEKQLRASNLKKSDDCDELRTVAEECSEGIDRISGIVDRMRRFSRMRANEQSDVDINEALADSLKMARMCGDTTLTVRFQPDSSLPSVHGSHGHIVQLLLNLISNARQAVDGVEHPSVEIDTQVRASAISVRIRDNGPGIPSRIQGRIFDPFFTTKAPGEGTGLGLPIAYGIARQHGGSLEFEPSPSGGAQFTLVLPIEGMPDGDFSTG